MSFWETAQRSEVGFMFFDSHSASGQTDLFHTLVHQSLCRIQSEWCLLGLCNWQPWQPPTFWVNLFISVCPDTSLNWQSIHSPGKLAELQTSSAIPWRCRFSRFGKTLWKPPLEKPPQGIPKPSSNQAWDLGHSEHLWGLGARSSSCITSLTSGKTSLCGSEVLGLTLCFLFSLLQLLLLTLYY